jgi:hypothetical protein
VGPRDIETVVVLEEDGKVQEVRVADMVEERRRKRGRKSMRWIGTRSKAADPRILLLQTIEAMRRHLLTCVEIMERLYEVQEVERFQQEVLEVIEEADPAVADRIRANVQKRRALRTVLQCTRSGDGG